MLTDSNRYPADIVNKSSMSELMKQEIRQNTKCELIKVESIADGYIQHFRSPSAATVLVERKENGLVRKVRVIRNVDGITVEC
jgi:hypothetical protein